MLTKVEAGRYTREKHVCEVKTCGSKLKNVKCYIQEVNSNIQANIEDVKTVHEVRNEDTKQSDVMMKERNKEFGFPNPFLPGGQVNEEADLIVRLWTEGRLAEFFNKVNYSTDHSEIEVEQKQCKETKKETKVVSNIAEEVNKTKQNGNQKKKKEKFRKFCCIIM